MRLIDADELSGRMYHEVFDGLNDELTKWDSGCWIRYKLFEQVLNGTPTVEAEPTEEQVKEYCRKRCLVVVSSELFNEMKARWTGATHEEPTRN